MILPKQSEPAMRTMPPARIVGTRKKVMLSTAVGTTSALKSDIVPAQALPICGTGDFTNCLLDPTSNCPGGGCQQRCQVAHTVVPIFLTECCPPEICGKPNDCCKQICCEVVVR